MQLSPDCDGVLADFYRAATALLGMPPHTFEQRRSIGAFRCELARYPDFYGPQPPMPGAKRLFGTIRMGGAGG